MNHPQTFDPDRDLKYYRDPTPNRLKDGFPVLEHYRSKDRDKKRKAKKHINHGLAENQNT